MPASLNYYLLGFEEGDMKINPKFYLAQVQAGTNGAGIICITYHLDSAGKYSGAEFYELVYTTYENFNIPSERQATFQEELRALHQAAATFGGDRTNEKEFLRSKLQEAYGSGATIHFQDVHPRTQPGHQRAGETIAPDGAR